MVDRSGVVEVDEMDVRLLLLPECLELVSNVRDILPRSPVTERIIIFGTH